MIRTLIVDDEPIARRGLALLLSREPDIEIAGEAASGSEAVELIEAQSPDVVFLDVQMPELNGFEVLENLDMPRLPIIVFVTAHDEFAIKAFDVEAIDYLLKPFDRERFAVALDRVRRHLKARDQDDLQGRMKNLLERYRPGTLERLIVRDAGRMFFLPIDEIEWIEAAGNYVRVHSGKTSHLIRHTITALTDRLPAADFLRVSRSAVVHLRRVREVQSLFNGCFVFVLPSGARVESSRRFRAQITAALDANT